VQKLYIFGAGEFAQIACEYFLETEAYDFKGFIIDADFKNIELESISGFPVFSFSEVEKLIVRSEVRIFVAISASQMNTSRTRVYNRLKLLGCNFATYISPKSFVSSKSTIGENVFIFEENVIQSGVSIGNNTVLWSGNHIGHQSTIGSNVFFASHVVLSGYCSVGEYCYFGVNSTIVDHLKIAPGTLIGAGSLILRDTEPNSVYVGSPGKRIEGKDPYKVIFR
jgi:sugar O-acyltransferase (sialic acid O-acetyltransferase NeuD family)